MDMSHEQLMTPTIPTSFKIRLAYRFLVALQSLNTNRSSSFDHMNHHRVKIAAYASMASVGEPRRAWSRAILRKIRNNRGRRHHVLAGNKKRRVIHAHHIIRRSTRRNPRRGGVVHVDPFVNSGQELRLRKLVPGAETMDPCGLLDETADYIKCLATQVEVMRTLVDLYSTI